MPEQSNGGTPGDMPPDEAASAHAETIASTIRDLAHYGPLKISTRHPGIPGIEYGQPYPNDETQTPIAYIGSMLLSVEVNEADVSVKVHGSNHAKPFVLTPGQIESVFVDHPWGRHMPLQGRELMATSLTEYNGLLVLRWPDHVIENGWYDRVDIANHPEHPGITVVKTYQADVKDITKAGPAEVPLLDEAKEKDTAPRTFLITRINDETYIVTSRLGIEETTPIIVRKPKEPRDGQLLHIEMLNMKNGTGDHELVDLHIKRYQELSEDFFGTPRWPMSQFDADKVFLYMVSD